jgi:hypothetical protein
LRVALAALLVVPWFTIAGALAVHWWPRLGPTEEAAYPVRYVVACVPYYAADGTLGWSCVDDTKACLWPGVP